MRAGKLFLAVWLLIGAASDAFAVEKQGRDGFTLSGNGMASVKVTRDTLAALPATRMDVSFLTAKGESKGRYEGVLVWTLLKSAGLEDSPERRELRRVFAVTGDDGYTVVFSIGEIAPDFGDTRMIVALKMDGKALAGDRLRLIVPGDKRGARSVRGIATIELR